MAQGVVVHGVRAPTPSALSIWQPRQFQVGRRQVTGRENRPGAELQAVAVVHHLLALTKLEKMFVAYTGTARPSCSKTLTFLEELRG